MEHIHYYHRAESTPWSPARKHLTTWLVSNHRGAHMGKGFGLWSSLSEQWSLGHFTHTDRYLVFRVKIKDLALRPSVQVV